MTQENQAPAEELAAPSSADSILAVMRFLRVVWHRRIYVVSALVVAGLLGGLYYFTANRIYQATAQLLILQTGPDMLSPTMAGATNREALIPTYERLFSSTVVLEGAIRELLKAPPQMRVDFAAVPREKWLDVLRSNLSASAVRRTNVIEVSYRSRDPKAAEAVVQAAVQSYLEFMERNHKNVSAEIVQILEKERVEISQQLDQRQRDMITVQKKVRDMGLSGKQDVVHPAVQRVMRLNESLVKVQQDRLQLEASLAAIRAAVREGADLRQHLNDIEPLIGREMMLSALGLNTQDAEARASIERRMMEDRAKLQTLLEHYGEAHPKVMEVAQAIRGAEEYLRNYQSQAEQRLSGLDDQRLGSDAGVDGRGAAGRPVGTREQVEPPVRSGRRRSGPVERPHGRIADGRARPDAAPQSARWPAGSHQQYRHRQGPNGPAGGRGQRTQGLESARFRRGCRWWA